MNDTTRDAPETHRYEAGPGDRCAVCGEWAGEEVHDVNLRTGEPWKDDDQR